jgi:Ca2+-binding RTX toxin-like protein
VTYTLGNNQENLTLTGDGFINGTGNDLDNIIIGNNQANLLEGEGGNDTLTSGGGDDSLDGGEGADAMTGGAGADTYFVDDAGDTVVEVDEPGIDLVISEVDFSLNEPGRLFVENLTLVGTAINGTGNALDNTILGNDENNVLQGLEGNDFIVGGVGRDRLDGGAGVDTLQGGAGNDTYVIDSIDDSVFDDGTSQGDLIESFIDIDLEDGYEGVEDLTLLGTATGGFGDAAANIITGNDLDNDLRGRGGNDQLIGRGGNDRLDGGAGNDTMDGGAGDDTYVVDSNDDVVSETNADPLVGGIDTVESSAISLALGSNIENLILLPETGATEGFGNALDNEIVGNENDNVLEGRAGNDTITGGAGIDTMRGGVGSDTFFVDNSADEVIESIGQGTQDVIFSDASYTLATGSEIEELRLNQVETAISAIGNEFNNLIVGNDFDNLLDGGVGIDRLEGRDGDDTYIIDNAGDRVAEISAGNAGGIDIIRSSVSYDLTTGGAVDVENLILLPASPDALDATGNDLDNFIQGNEFNNTLDGGLGVDTLIGGDGDDFYFIDNPDDRVTENGDEGIDTVQSTQTYTLTANVERLILAPGAGSISGTGNDLDNEIFGNEADNSLSGGDGNDLLDGGAGIDAYNGGSGNDTFFIDNTAEVITEGESGGIDVVESNVTYTLGDNLENLILQGGTGTDDLNGTGNNLANLIIGNNGNNVLTGRAGNDIIQGRGGNDILRGGAGIDTMFGGAGDDEYTVNQEGDIVDETDEEGNDTGGTDSVISDIDYTLTAFVENLTLRGTTGTENLNGTGNTRDNIIIGNDGDNILNGGAGIDQLTGNAGNDFLDGGSGNDVMTGGVGDDTYVVTSTAETLTEELDEGIDLVISSAESFTLGANFENLQLEGTALEGIGNELDNLITGTDGNNVLNGGLGQDTLRGGAGDDEYVVNSFDDPEDTIEEESGAGTDTVRSTGTFTLSDNLEILILEEGGNFNGFGNDEANTITGNEQDNRLDGGAGIDALAGGGGNDTFVIDEAADNIQDSGGIDWVVINSTTILEYNLAALPASVQIENLELIGTSDINATGDELDNIVRGNQGDNRLVGQGGADTIEGGAGNDILLGQRPLPVSFDDGADILRGQQGNDILNGNAGDDILNGGEGVDLFRFNSGRVFDSANLGVDTVQDFTAGEDRIVLNRTTFTVLTGGSDVSLSADGLSDLSFKQLQAGDFAQVNGTAGIDTLAAAVIYDTAGQQLYYNADRTGAGAAVAFAQFSNNPNITRSSFLIEET